MKIDAFMDEASKKQDKMAKKIKDPSILANLTREDKRAIARGT